MHGNSILPLLVLGTMILLGISSAFASVRDRRAKTQLHQYGVTTTAKVIRRSHETIHHTNTTHHNTTSSEIYSISYQYTVNGATYTGSESVGAETYDALQEGQPVEVVYLPEHPNEARLASSL